MYLLAKAFMPKPVFYFYLVFLCSILALRNPSSIRSTISNASAMTSWT